jgi:hypothetical protein
MQNRRTFLIIAKIAQRCRLVILLLLATGVIGGGTHWHVTHNPDAYGTSSYSEFNSLDAPAIGIAVFASTASSSCPSHVSCHQQVFDSNGTDLTLLPTQDSSRRHLPGDTTVRGNSTALDYPPPKA